VVQVIRYRRDLVLRAMIQSLAILVPLKRLSNMTHRPSRCHWLARSSNLFCEKLEGSPITRTFENNVCFISVDELKVN